MIKSNFRIIAVRVLGECAKEIKRALKPDTTYFLCNDYEDSYDEFGNWVRIRRVRESAKRLPADFFTVPEKDFENHEIGHIPTISVSAIVGKNGDGKSSLIELMLRIVNNFSVKYGFTEDQESLAYAQGVHAILFYEIGEKIYSISCHGEDVKTSFVIEGKNKGSIIQHRQTLFYTIVANYSIYAYNARNFQREVEDDENCWINGVFHKNDSYQTPLVLNPMRTDGNFDVNKEENLCRQRLMALYADLGDVPEARVINGDKTASGFAFNLEELSKLELTTLKSYFKNVWKSTDLNFVASHFESYLE